MSAEPLPPRVTPSLAARIAARLSAHGAGRDVRAGIAVALLLAAAPAAVWAGARWTETGVRRDIAAVTATAKPRLDGLAARTAARAELDTLLAVPGVGGTLEALTRALPADASLARVARGPEGRLAIDVAAADPDRLRAALRRHPATAGLRDAGQRGGDGVMLVTLESAR
ncbi:MAG: hypothetical protein V4537_12290 [Pseudomonadota bacterium]